MLAFVSLPAGAHGTLHDLIDQADRNLSTHPGNPRLLLERAELLRQHGEFDRSMADLAAVGNRDPRRLLVMARIHLDLDRPAVAKADLDRYLAKHPDSPEAWLLRSQAAERQADPVTAIGDARQLLRCQDHAPLNHHLHLIRLLKTHGSPQALKTAFADARKALGPVPSLLSSQAAWLAETGDREGAATVYAELRVAVPALAFPTRVAETRLWSGHDAARTRRARSQAEGAWFALAPVARSRPAMIEKRRELDQVPD